MLDIPLAVFHMCGLDAPLWAEWAYVASVAICGARQALGWNRSTSLTSLMIRLGGLRLHPCVDNKNQVYPGPTAHVITSHEDLNPGLVDLFLYHADFQPHRVGVCGDGEGEPEELPSCVSFRVRLSTIERWRIDVNSLWLFIHRAPVV